MKTVLRLSCVLLGVAAVAWMAANGRGDEQAGAVHPAGDPLPYAGILEELLGQIGSGRIEDGLDLFAQHAGGLNDAARDSLRSQFSTLRAGGGTFDGVEIVAVQVISPRLHRVFALMHLERSPIVFVVQMRHLQGRWQIGHLQYSTDVMQHLGGAPIRFSLE